MTTPTEGTARRGSLIGIIGLVVLAVAGGVVGAYLDWKWWHPASGIVVTIAAVALLVVGGVAWASRWRPIRPVALATLAIGVGALIGQNVGPSRPPITNVDGSITITLTQPPGATPITGRADCQLTDGGENFAISSDVNLRIQVGEQPREEQDPFHLVVARGDMWEYGREPRDDRWSMLVLVGEAGPIADDAFPVEVAMVSDRDSQIEAEGGQDRGRLGFSRLTLDSTRSPDATEAVDVAGTVEWSCEG